MHEVLLAKKALEQIEEIKNTSYYENVIQFIAKLKEEFFPKGYDLKKLRGERVIRVRFGKYRMLYEIFPRENKVEVYSLLLRKAAYKHK